MPRTCPAARTSSAGVFSTPSGTERGGGGCIGPSELSPPPSPRRRLDQPPTNDPELRTAPARRQSPAVSDLALHCEETGDVEGARAVAGWSVDVGVGHWSDPMRRPGYLLRAPRPPVEDVEVEEGDSGRGGMEGPRRPHYPRETHPAWCARLEENYQTIQGEFLDLARGGSGKRGRSDPPSVDGGLSQPLHWPSVGSGTHRAGGADDHRVVSDGGDWREFVLFGAGVTRDDSSFADAPRTRSLVRRYCPDAVSLAEAGGGEVIFSVLAPRTRVKPHSASTDIRLTAHLGLDVPYLVFVRVVED